MIRNICISLKLAAVALVASGLSAAAQPPDMYTIPAEAPASGAVDEKLAPILLGQEPPAEPAKPAEAAPTDTSEGFRLSALIKAGDIIKAGLINLADDRHKFVAPGEKFYDAIVLGIDYDGESVTLERDGKTFSLQLAADPNAVQAAADDATDDLNRIWRGEGIEQFLKDHPDAVIKTGPSFKSLGYVPGPPVTGLGPGIEEHLKDNPELREKLLKPVEGLGEGIESHLKDNPELRKELEQPVTGLGPGIESYLKENPELLKELERPVEGLGYGIEEMRKQVEQETGEAPQE